MKRIASVLGVLLGLVAVDLALTMPEPHSAVVRRNLWLVLLIPLALLLIRYGSSGK